MNCLIAGMTNSGKTTLARRLMSEHGYSRIPGDSLVQAFHLRFPEMQIAHAEDHNHYQITCKRFGSLLVGLMDTLHWEDNRLSYVVDTFHAWPADIVDIDRTKTAVLFLGYPEVALEDKCRHLEKFGFDSSRVRLFIDMSRELREQCREFDFPFVDTSHNFEQVIAETVAHLCPPKQIA